MLSLVLWASTLWFSRSLVVLKKASHRWQRLMLAMTKDEAEDQEMIANTSYSMQFVYSWSLKVDSDQS